MSIAHARSEFMAVGWLDRHGIYVDEMQAEACKNVFELMKVFESQGHSGNSAVYVSNLFHEMAMYKLLGPLTGKDDEWMEVGDGVFQNKRAGHVFKGPNGAYDIDGIIFYDVYKDDKGVDRRSYFTCSESKVSITFPYTPSREYREREKPTVVEEPVQTVDTQEGVAWLVQSVDPTLVASAAAALSGNACEESKQESKQEASSGSGADCASSSEAGEAPSAESPQ